MKKFIEIITSPLVGLGRKKQDHFVLPPDIMMEHGYDAEIIFTNPIYKPEVLKKRFSKGTKFRHIPSFFSYFKYLFKNRDAIIFVNTRTLKSFLTGFFGKYNIFMSHNSSLPAKWHHRMTLKFFLQFFDAVRVVNNYERNELVKLGVNANKIHVIPLSIDHEHYAKKLFSDKIKSFKKKYGIKDSDKIILFLAQIRKFKNPKNMLKAFKILSEKHNNYKLLIVGQDLLKDENEPNITELIQKFELDNKKIIQTGALSMNDIPIALNISHVGVNTSVHEGMCLVVYELASAGIPLCLSNISSFTSVLGKTALFHEPDDYRTLANNIEKYFTDNKLRNKHILANKKLVKELADYNNVKRKLEKLLLY